VVGLSCGISPTGLSGLAPFILVFFLVARTHSQEAQHHQGKCRLDQIRID
jgi:hypothetical protein